MARCSCFAMRRVELLFFVLAATLTAACPLAVAEQVDAASAAQKRAAQKMFEAADGLYESGRYAEAAKAFRASHGIVASPNSRLMLARSLRELGKLGEAYDELVGAAREAEASGRYPEAQRAAEAELAALKPRLAFVTVQLPAGTPAAQELRVSGREVPTASIGSPIAVTPGRTTILVRLEDGSVREQTLILETGQEAVVDFEAKPEEPPPAVPAPSPANKPAPPPVQPKETGPGLRTAAYIVGGVGVLGAVGFTVFGLLDRATYHDLEDNCPGGQCPLDRQSNIDAGERYQLLANVSLGVAVVGVAAGTVLFVLSAPKEKSADSVSVRLRPSTVSVEGRF